MFYIEELERYSGNIDMNDYSYMQISKRIVRHKILFHAVDTLTRKRGEACCVSRNYVRKVYDYFTQLLIGNIFMIRALVKKMLRI